MVKKFGPGTHTYTTDPWNNIRIKQVAGVGTCTLRAYDEGNVLQCELAISIPTQGHAWVEVPDVGFAQQNCKVSLTVPEGSSISLFGEFSNSIYNWVSQ